MSNSFLRRIATLQLIPHAPKKISTRALTERLEQEGFEAGQRTVQRDLVELAGLFPDLQNDGNRDIPGWSWRQGSALQNFPAIDPAQAFTFKLAESFLGRLIPPTLLEVLQPYFDASRKVLEELDSPGLGTWTDRVRMVSRGQPLIPARVDMEQVRVIYEALLAGRQFRARYRPRSEVVAEYEFHPLGLVFRESVAYLVATVWHYQDVRQYALHRFVRCELKEEPVCPPEGFSLAEYVKAGGFDYVDPEAPPIRLKALFTKQAAYHLRETPLSEDQTLEEVPPDRVAVSGTVHDSMQLRWWLLGFGDGVEVVEPPELREEFREMVGRMAGRYGKGPSSGAA